VIQILSSRVKRFERGNDIVLYNPFSQQLFFTDRDDIERIGEEDLMRLNSLDVRMEPPKLRKVRVEATFGCDSACDYCLVYGNPLEQLHTAMSMETARGIIGFFNQNVREGSMMIIGGEPLTNWDVVEYLIDNIEGNAQLFTNAIKMSPKKAEFLARKGSRVYVSLDGMRRHNTHRRYHNGRETFDDTLKGYKMLQEAGISPSITCLSTQTNVYDLDEIFDFFVEELGCRAMGISIPHHTEFSHLPFTQTDIHEYTSQMAGIFKKARRGGIFVDQIAKRLAPIIQGYFRPYACKIAGEQVTFYPDGTQTLCTKLDTLPDFNGIKAEDLFNKTPYFDLTCQECEAISTCGGGCFWDAYHDGSGHDIRDCYFTRQMLNVFLWDISDFLKDRGMPITRDNLRKEYSVC